MMADLQLISMAELPLRVMIERRSRRYKRESRQIATLSAGSGA
jgi:hypothetical protein